MEFFGVSCLKSIFRVKLSPLGVRNRGIFERSQTSSFYIFLENWPIFTILFSECLFFNSVFKMCDLKLGSIIRFWSKCEKPYCGPGNTETGNPAKFWCPGQKLMPDSESATQNKFKNALVVHVTKCVLASVINMNIN